MSKIRMMKTSEYYGMMVMEGRIIQHDRRQWVADTIEFPFKPERRRRDIAVWPIWRQRL